MLREAELLLEEGLEAFSIPELAKRLGYTRMSIYKFFPTPCAVLNELTLRYLDRLTGALERRGAELATLAWDEMVVRRVGAAAEFHNANPVGRILILGGAVTDDSYRVTEYTIEKLGTLTNALLAQRGLQVTKQHPNVGSLAVEIGTAVFRVSQFYFKRLTPEYVEEAAVAMRAYLAPYVAAARPSRREQALGVRPRR